MLLRSLPRPFRLISPLVVAVTLTAGLLTAAAPASAAAPAAAPALAGLPAKTSVPTPADIARLQAAVDALTATVQRTAKELAAGTRDWEAGKRRLADTQRRAATAKHAAARAGAEVADARQEIGSFAAAAYRNPLPTDMTLLLATGAEQVPDTLAALGYLAHAGGSEADAVRRLTVARLQAQQSSTVAAQLTAQAAVQAKALQRQVAVLQAKATEVGQRLATAQGRVSRARERRAAHLAWLASVRAARLARHRAAARDRARALAEARAAARAVRGSGGGPSCTGASGNYANGMLPDSALCPLWGAPGMRLQGRAAAAFNRMSKYHAATVGGPICVTDSYRSYAAQVDVYRRKPTLAAVPGTSNHGWGLAVDLCGGVQSFGTSGYNWMKANGAKFGFFHPSWAEPWGSKPEPWHWEFGHIS